MEYLFFGIILILSGAATLAVGDHYWRGGWIPEWTAWPQLVAGFVVLIISLRAYWRNKGKSTPKGYTTEEIAQSKVELEAMHLRDYGKSTEDSEKER